MNLWTVFKIFETNHFLISTINLKTVEKALINALKSLYLSKYD